MDSSEKPSFAGVLAMLAETFNTDIGPRGVDGYWVALQTLSFADFTAAVHACLRECRFMPKPAEILERAPAGNVDMLAAQAWESVTKVSHRGGDKLPDPVANRVVAMMGGWRKITSDAVRAVPRLVPQGVLADVRAGCSEGERGRSVVR